MLVGVHAMLAMQTKTPELAITEDEGKAFMRAAQNVARHYSVETTQKTLDWVAFLGVAGSMYGTRFAAVQFRKRNEREAGGQVLRFRPRPVETPAGGPTEPPPTGGTGYTPSVVPGPDDEFGANG
jgi:hypothetical protein